MKYILFFKKQGYMAYISSLDTVSIITRALRRAQVPFSWTEGFSPHPKLSFSPSLSLGFESNTEFFEMELKESITKGILKEKLNEELPNGLKITRIIEEVPHIFSMLSAHSFNILIETEKNGSLKKEIVNILGSDNLKIIKTNKKGKKVVYPLKDYIYNFSVKKRQKCLLLKIILHIKEGKSLNPKDILLLLKNHGLTFNLIRIKRSGFFINQGEKFLKL